MITWLMSCSTLVLRTQVRMCPRICKKLPSGHPSWMEILQSSLCDGECKLAFLKGKNQQVWKWLHGDWMSHSVSEQRILFIAFPARPFMKESFNKCRAAMDSSRKDWKIVVRCFLWNVVNLKSLLLESCALDCPPSHPKKEIMNTKNWRRKYWERKEKKNFTNARDAGYRMQMGKRQGVGRIQNW